MKISVLDQSYVIDGGTPELALEQTTELAQYVDELGYHRYWVSEHHHSEALAGSSPEVLIAYLTAKTKRIRVGSGGVMLPHYSAYKVAENFNVLSTLAPGRIDVGIGRAPGGMPLSTRALQDLQARDIDTFPEQVQHLISYIDDKWSGEQPFSGLKATPIPSCKPEVWMLGSSDSSGYVAGQLGLPYAFAHFINSQPGAMDQAIRYYLRTFQASSRLAEPKVLAAMKIIVADTDAEANELAASALHLTYLLYRGRLQPLVSPKTVNEYPYTASERAEVEAMKRTFLIGSVQTVAQKIKALQEQYPIEELMAVSPIYDVIARKRSFALLKQAVDEASAGKS
ncbi:LLM class flavin-dependent oxidoreductase [Brevibacillus laterosporus]|uniref:LLM class flavin-dependent oxidoreductase n=1 Tax=Brevibacillus laterosporus TaxID=1465 RepID=A0A502I5F3_BRELA|nr:LLM class flavin-dependent oxidoreductase [Brevibacillus laterosporus]QDX94014.1 LLM class flavin-dependent oxidoreductase [Brevibacillus laterosporus]TPG67972.1 LLM class flavin-dependent oxidoreductase [Brevibacillus laterosporus]TPG81313.1 LLM class flavin-dependent oxidoreductase [Brevibacillus laterosporus]